MPLKAPFLAAALCLLAPAAHALNTAQCGEIEAQAFTALDAHFDIEITQSPTSTTHAMLNGCASSDLDIYAGDLGLMFRAERLVFTGDNLTQWARGEVILPTQLNLRLDGVTVTNRFPTPPDLAWLTTLAGPDQPAQIDIQWTWAEATQQLTLRAARVDFQNGNAVTLGLSGQAAGWQPNATPTVDLTTTQITLDADFNGLFEQAVAAPLTASGIDMSANSMAFIAMGLQGLIPTAPPGLIHPDSGAAIVAFARTLPTPRGQLQLTFTSPTPFNAARVLENLRTGIPFATAVPQGLNIDAIWTRSN